MTGHESEKFFPCDNESYAISAGKQRAKSENRSNIAAFISGRREKIERSTEKEYGTWDKKSQ